MSVSSTSIRTLVNWSLTSLFSTNMAISETSPYVRPLRPYVYPSVHKKFFSDFNEIWYVMRYDPIQGQGHGASEVPKIALFKVYLLRHLQRYLANDHRFLN